MLTSITFLSLTHTHTHTCIHTHVHTHRLSLRVCTFVDEWMGSVAVCLLCHRIVAKPRAALPAPKGLNFLRRPCAIRTMTARLQVVSYYDVESNWTSFAMRSDAPAQACPLEIPLQIFSSTFSMLTLALLCGRLAQCTQPTFVHPN